MVNLEHKLTVDDLIVEYMIYKAENGYEPSFTTGEFIKFLFYFETRMEVYDTLYDGEKLFKRFFERKNKDDWSIIKNWYTKEKEIKPHMDMIFNSEHVSYLIRANYKLSASDKSIINTYFMDNGMGRYKNFKGQAFKIRSIIGEWLENYHKREIDESVEVDEKELLIGKYIATEIILNIWNTRIDKLIKNYNWPSQCKDINKYLFDIDLAEIIGIKSIKNDLVELYNALSKRIAILYNQDKNLKITSSSYSYLAHANYKLLIQGYENIMNDVFGEYKKNIEIDLNNLTFKETHEISGSYYYDEDPDTKTTTTTVGNEKAKKLIKSFEQHNQN